MDTDSVGKMERRKLLQKQKAKLCDVSYKLYSIGGYSYDYRFMQHIQTAIAGIITQIALLDGQMALPEDPGYKEEDDTPF